MVLLKTVEIVILMRRRDFANEVDDTVMDEEERKGRDGESGRFCLFATMRRVGVVAWVVDRGRS